MGMQNSQVFTDFIALIEKFGQDEAFQRVLPLNRTPHVLPQDTAFLALLRIFFGRMLLSWGIIKDPNNPLKIFREFFSTGLPTEVTQTLSRHRFGRTTQKNQDNTLLYPEIFCELYENYLNVKRHSTGSFYTPDFITEFMSQENINKIFREILPLTIERDILPETSSGTLHVLQIVWGKVLEKMTICDPACGTGRFLVAVATGVETVFFTNAYPENWHSGLGPGSSINPEFRIYLRKFILENCIYGVEKDPIAAEICRLRLIAWFLEIIPKNLLDEAISLPDLSHIKVGNSLIGFSSIPTEEIDLQEKIKIRSRILAKLHRTTRSQMRESLQQTLSQIEGDLQTILNKHLLNELENQGVPVAESNLREIKPFHWPFEFGCRFTLLIGNPPYGNILSKVEKDILRQRDTMVDEVYINFLMRILRDEIPFQYASFLTPKSYLIRQNYREFREMLLTKACPYAIHEIGSKKFKGALNEVQVLSFHRDPSYSSQLVIGSIGTAPSMVYGLRALSTSIPPIDALKVCKNAQCTGLNGSSQFELYTRDSHCPACGKPVAPLNRIRLKLDPLKYHLIEQIEKAGDVNYLNPWDFPDLKRGEEDQGLKRVRSALLSYDSKLCAFISAKNDFSPYYLHPQKSFDLGQVQTQKDPRFYAAGPKLLIKHNSIAPEAAFTLDAACFTAAVYSLLHPDEKVLKYLCGLFNSTLMQFYCIFGINNQNLVTMNLNQYMIRHLPIISLQKAGATAEMIVSFVNQILKKTINAGGAFDAKNSSDVEQLNQVIYALYGISGEETISLIEHSVDDSMHFFTKTRRKT